MLTPIVKPNQEGKKGIEVPSVKDSKWKENNDDGARGPVNTKGLGIYTAVKQRSISGIQTGSLAQKVLMISQLNWHLVKQRVRMTEKNWLSGYDLDNT